MPGGQTKFYEEDGELTLASKTWWDFIGKLDKGGLPKEKMRSQEPRITHPRAREQPTWETRSQAWGRGLQGSLNPNGQKGDTIGH